MNQATQAFLYGLCEGWTFDRQKMKKCFFFKANVLKTEYKKINYNSKKFYATVWTFKDGSKCFDSKTQKLACTL